MWEGEGVRGEGVQIMLCLSAALGYVLWYAVESEFETSVKILLCSETLAHSYQVWRNLIQHIIFSRLWIIAAVHGK